MNTIFAPGYNIGLAVQLPPALVPAPLDAPLIAFMRCRRPMRQCDIAEALGINAGTICHALQRLEKKGVVRKQGRLFEFVGEKE